MASPFQGVDAPTVQIFPKGWEENGRGGRGGKGKRMGGEWKRRGGDGKRRVGRERLVGALVTSKVGAIC